MLRTLLNASIAAKMMAFLALVIALFLGALLFGYLPAFERELMKDRRDSLKDMGEVADSLLSEYHSRAEQGEFSQEEAQERAVQRIANLRYGNNDYFWINDRTLPVPRMIMHPIIAGLDGKALDDAHFYCASKMEFGIDGRVEVIPSGDKNLFQAFVEVVNESGEGYVTYAWPKPGKDGPSEELFPKESYVKLFEPWGWVVGTGAYIDDIEARLARLRWSIFFVTGAILTVAMIILTSFVLAFVIQPMNALMRYAERVSAGELNAEVKGRFYAESARFKSVITQMVDDLEAAIKEAKTKQGEARQEAEKSRQLTEKLEALFTSMTEIVGVHDLVFDASGTPVNYRIIDCNDAFTKIIGVNKENLVGKLATEVYPNDVAPHLDTYARVAMSGEACTFEMHDGRLHRYFSVSVVSPAKNRFATIATDITADKLARQTIAAKNKDLEQIIYVASHDLRSPLVNVDGYARELEYSVDEFANFLDADDNAAEQLEGAVRSALPDMNDALHHIRHSTRQMDALLKGLLKLSRSGRAALNVGPVNMNHLVSRCISSLEFQSKEAGVEIHVGELPPCRSDAVQITQVLTNLLGNALKFLSKERPGIIEVTGTAEDGRCVYCVRDNGIGIAREHQENIFELFHRLNPYQTEGEGLGLTIVRQILGRLDGEIWLESELDEGSSFYVSLPAIQPTIETRGAEGVSPWRKHGCE